MRNYRHRAIPGNSPNYKNSKNEYDSVYQKRPETSKKLLARNIDSPIGESIFFQVNYLLTDAHAPV